MTTRAVRRREPSASATTSSPPSSCTVRRTTSSTSSSSARWPTAYEAVDEPRRLPRHRPLLRGQALLRRGRLHSRPAPRGRRHRRPCTARRRGCSGARTPVVAAVQGAAIGGGLGLACSADFRVACPEARFAANFARLGFHHGFALVGRPCPPSSASSRRSTCSTPDAASPGTKPRGIGLCDRLVDAGDVRSRGARAGGGHRRVGAARRALHPHHHARRPRRPSPRRDGARGRGAGPPAADERLGRKACAPRPSAARRASRADDRRRHRSSPSEIRDRAPSLDRRGVGPRAQPRSSGGARLADARVGLPDVAARVGRPRAAGGVRGGRRRRAGERRRAGTARRRRHASGGTDDARARLRRPEAPAPRARSLTGEIDLVPAVQRAGRGIRPRRPHDARRARRRRVDRQRAEGVEHRRRARRLRLAAGPHRLGRAEAPRHHLLRRADAPAGHRGPAAAPDERPRVVQRGVPRRGAGARRQRDRRRSATAGRSR